MRHEGTVSRRAWVTGQMRGSSQGTLEPWAESSTGQDRHRISVCLPRTPKTKVPCEVVDIPDEMEAFGNTGMSETTGAWDGGREW